jgi:hypothetical protein
MKEFKNKPKQTSYSYPNESKGKDEILKDNFSYDVPISNQFTVDKDRNIIRKYGMDFLRFFSSGQCQSLPMFTEPPTPKSVKRITNDLSITVTAGNPLNLYIRPFDNILILHSQSASPSAIFGRDAVNCFVEYRVVAAKIRIKQVGILSMSDGYGTVMDAVVCNPAMPLSFLSSNLLNVQAGPGQKVTMIDGRKGIQANFIGSPFFNPKSPFSGNLYVNMVMSHMGPTPYGGYVPANTMFYAPGGTSLFYEDGTSGAVPNEGIVQKNDTIIGTDTHLLYANPQGEALFVKVSPPSINIVIKVYVDMVVEGLVLPDYAVNMPQIVPPVPFSFERIKWALRNFVPMVHEDDTKMIGFCAQGMNCKEFKKPKIKVVSFNWISKNLIKESEDKEENGKEIGYCMLRTPPNLPNNSNNNPLPLSYIVDNTGVHTSDGRSFNYESSEEEDSFSEAQRIFKQLAEEGEKELKKAIGTDEHDPNEDSYHVLFTSDILEGVIDQLDNAVSKDSLREYLQKNEKISSDLTEEDFLNWIYDNLPPDRIKIFIKRKAKIILDTYRKKFSKLMLPRENTKDKKPVISQMYKLTPTERKELGFCMLKTKIKQEVKIKKKLNQVKEPEVPDILEEASDFCGFPVSILKTSTNANRLFRDGTAPLPEVNYQYFPILDQRLKPSVGIVVFKRGKTEGYEENKISVTDANGDEKTISLYLKLDDFEKPDDYLANLESIINYLYGYAYHKIPEEPYTIAFFSNFKLSQSSYMYALLMAMYGGPSGGFYTGGFKYIDQDRIEIFEMEQKIIEAKLGLASPECPLMVLSKDMYPGQFINIVAGIVLSFSEGSLIGSNDLKIATIYGLLPFTSRTIKRTPFYNYAVDDKQIILEKGQKDSRKYIAYSNIYNEAKLTNLIDNGVNNWKMFLRTNPDNYTCYISEKGKYILARDFYDKHEDLLQDKNLWRYRLKGHLFVEKNRFLSDIRKVKSLVGMPLTEKKQEELDLLNQEINSISEQQVKEAKSKAIDRINKINKEEKGMEYENFDEEAIRDKGKALEAIQENMNKMSRCLINLKRLETKFRGNDQKITNNSVAGQALQKMGILNGVRKECKVDEYPFVKHFVDFCKDCGVKGPLVIYRLIDPEAVDKGDANATLTVLNKILQYLKDFNEEADESYKDVDEVSVKKYNKLENKLKEKQNKIKKFENKPNSQKKGTHKEDEKEIKIKSNPQKVKGKKKEVKEEEESRSESEQECRDLLRELPVAQEYLRDSDP